MAVALGELASARDDRNLVGEPVQQAPTGVWHVALYSSRVRAQGCCKTGAASPSRVIGVFRIMRVGDFEGADPAPI